MRNYRIETIISNSILCVAIGNLAEILGYTGKPIDTSSQDFSYTNSNTLNWRYTSVYTYACLCVVVRY